MSRSPGETDGTLCERPDPTGPSRTVHGSRRPIENPLVIVEPPTTDSPQLQVVTGPGATPRRLPPWLRVNLPAGSSQRTFNATLATVESNALHTVCEEARCPNIHDCWARGTATFMIAGKECTRGCRFCSVETLKQPEPVDADEPRHLAEAVERMKLTHAVVTVVNRDDLPDGGARHYRHCIEAIHARTPHVTTELLCSDLAGNWDALRDLLEDLPLNVFAHNVECVARLDREVRDPRASFERSLEVLRRAGEIRRDVMLKSSLMVGLGETDGEVIAALRSLRGSGVELLTLGQYVAPGRAGERYMAVDRYVHPEQFSQWADEARDLGFLAVAAGPLVRSSYHAGDLLAEALDRKHSSRGTKKEQQAPTQVGDMSCE